MPEASCYKMEDEGGTGTETASLDILFKDITAIKQRETIQLNLNSCV